MEALFPARDAPHNSTPDGQSTAFDADMARGKYPDTRFLRKRILLAISRARVIRPLSSDSIEDASRNGGYGINNRKAEIEPVNR